jgi:hypothetical protein
VPEYFYRAEEWRVPSEQIFDSDSNAVDVLDRPSDKPLWENDNGYMKESVPQQSRREHVDIRRFLDGIP